MAEKPTVTLVDATEAKNRFGAIIRRAYLQEEHLIVRRDGIPVVAIIPVQDYERLINAARAGDDAAVEQAIEAGSRAGAGRARLRAFLAEQAAAADEVDEAAVDADVAAAVDLGRKRPGV